MLGILLNRVDTAHMVMGIRKWSRTVKPR